MVENQLMDDTSINYLLIINMHLYFRLFGLPESKYGEKLNIKFKNNPSISINYTPDNVVPPFYIFNQTLHPDQHIDIT